jgi:glycosyltransferase involved in cell wall biosynthesis
MIRISVITVVLNDRYGLVKTLTSLSHIDKDSYEHVIIDGGSTDGSLDVLNNFSERIDVVISESDNGTYDAMNKGVLNATGGVICFLNAGDSVLNGYISHPTSCFSENNDIDYCYAGVILHGNDKERLYIPREVTPASEYLQAMPFPHPGLFAKKELFDNIGYFDLSKKITADHEWIVRVLLSKAKGMRINHGVVKFNLDGMSLSHDTFFEMYQTAVKYGRSKHKAVFYFLYGLFVFIKYKIISKL